MFHFEVCAYLLNINEGKYFILFAITTGIHVVFRGSKFEPDADIGQKGTF
jgi:hypothetical protein